MPATLSIMMSQLHPFGNIYSYLRPSSSTTQHCEAVFQLNYCSFVVDRSW